MAFKTGRVVKAYTFHGRFYPLWRHRAMYLRCVVRFETLKLARNLQ